MIIYKTYRDFSDMHHQDYEEYGFYLDKNKAVKDLKKVIRVECLLRWIDEEKLANLKEKGVYEIKNIGIYGIEEVEVVV